MEAITEQKITVELTEEQYVHIQQLLKMDKPSKTKLTREEKGYIITALVHEQQAIDYDNQDDLTKWRLKIIDSIVRKLS